MKNQGGRPYEYAGYGDLPIVTVSCFYTNHIESRVGVVTPHFERQMHYSHSPFSLFFNKRVKTRFSSVRLSSLLWEAVEPLNAKAINI